MRKIFTRSRISGQKERDHFNTVAAVAGLILVSFNDPLGTKRHFFYRILEFILIFLYSGNPTTNISFTSVKICRSLFYYVELIEFCLNPMF